MAGFSFGWGGVSTRTILITGCSSGIGHHAAHGMKARGWRVFATARRECDVARLRDQGLEAFRLDYADPASIAAALGAVLAASGGTLAALFNNGGYAQPGAIEVAGVRLDPGTRGVTIDGKVVELTTTEFDLLELLMRSAGRVVSRREMTTLLYQREVSPFDRALDVHVSHLRKKHGRRDLIRTVRGTGYQFEAGSEEPRP